MVEVLYKGIISADQVEPGDFIKGWSFSKQQDVYRLVLSKFNSSRCAWRIVEGFRVTPCEAIYYKTQWLPAFKAPGSKFDDLVSSCVEITVMADEDEEHNYWLVAEDSRPPLLIHNVALPC